MDTWMYQFDVRTAEGSAPRSHCASILPLPAAASLFSESVTIIWRWWSPQLSGWSFSSQTTPTWHLSWNIGYFVLCPLRTLNVFQTLQTVCRVFVDVIEWKLNIRGLSCRNWAMTMLVRFIWLREWFTSQHHHQWLCLLDEQSQPLPLT